MCANELLIRDAIIQPMVSGRNMADSCRLPDAVPVSGSIGDYPSASPATAVDPIISLETLSIVANTQDSTKIVPTPVGEVADDTLNGALLVEPSV